MVNTGFPSKDCETCRQRRVKCDLRRPHCLRCEKIGRVCSGYRDLNKVALAFRVHTPTSFSDRASRKKQKRGAQGSATKILTWQSKGHDSGREEETPDNSCSPETTPSDSGAPIFLKGLVESWDSHVTPLILGQFSFPSISGGRLYGSLECLPTLLRDVEPGSTLDLTAKAVGYVHLANKTRSSKDQVIHRRIYGESLRGLQKSLRDPQHQKKDEILLSVWLSCLYELMLGNLPGEPDRGPVNWYIHSTALVAILRSRGAQQFQTKTGCQLFQLAYHYVQIQALQTNAAPPMQMLEWLAMINTTANVDELFFIPSFLYGDEITRLCYQANVSYNQAATTSEKIGTIDQSLEEFRELQSHMKASSAKQKFPVAKTPPQVEAPHTSQRGVFRVRNHIDACVLRVYAIILELLFYTTELMEVSQEDIDHIVSLQEIITEESRVRAANIIESLPCLFPTESMELPSWAEALRLLWPLRMVLYSTAPEPSQKETAKYALTRVSNEVGIKQALSLFLPDTYKQINVPTW